MNKFSRMLDQVPLFVLVFVVQCLFGVPWLVYYLISQLIVGELGWGMMAFNAMLVVGLSIGWCFVLWAVSQEFRD